MRSRARCDLGDPQWDAKMRRSEHLSPDFFWTLRFDDPGDFQTWAGGLCEVTESCHRVYVDIPSFFWGGIFPVVKLYYVGTLFLKVSLGWKPKNLTFVVPKLCFLKAGYLKEICSRSLRIWRTWDLPNVEFWGILQTIKQGEDSERRKAALKAEKRFANERLKRGKYAQKAFPFASLEDDSKMLAPQRHATDWGRWTW